MIHVTITCAGISLDAVLWEAETCMRPCIIHFLPPLSHYKNGLGTTKPQTQAVSSKLSLAALDKIRRKTWVDLACDTMPL